MIGNRSLLGDEANRPDRRWADNHDCRTAASAATEATGANA
jgi:hypothetical protein